MAHHGMGTTMAHVWWFGTEEQFYLLWPILFDMHSTPQITPLAGVPDSGRMDLPDLAAILPACRVGIGAISVYHAVPDALAIGCLGGRGPPHATAFPVACEVEMVIGRGDCGDCVLPTRDSRFVGHVHRSASRMAWGLEDAVTHAKHIGIPVARLSSAMRWLCTNHPYSVYLYHYFSDDIVRGGGMA